MDKIAFLFSGQGSQYVGMGIKLQNYPVGKETFREANAILGMDIAFICCNGSDEDLADTEITQPAILTCSIAALRVLMSDDVEASINPVSKLSQVSGTGSFPFPKLEASAAAGLSVGEYSALVANGALSFADALRLVKERGRLMAEAAAANPGMMAAILGLDAAVVKSICEEASFAGMVLPSNYNCPGQTVISGEIEAVRQAVELARRAGAKRCVALDVSGAFHSPLMRPAESGLRGTLSGVPFSKPMIPFVASVTGDYLDDPEAIREMLALQLSSPIQWEASMRRMIDDGICNFVEIGPGKVLASMARRIDREVKVFSTDDVL